MSKVVKAALVAAAIVFTAGAITVGFAAGSMTALTFGTGLGLTATGMAVFTFVTTLVGGLIGGMGSRGGPAGSGNFGTKFAGRAPVEPRQIIYGQCRVGGTYVHMSTSGTDNNLFHGIVVLAGHEIESLVNVKINDTTLTTSTTTLNGETVYKVTNSKFRNTDNDNKLDSSGTLIRYTFENGSQTTANGFMVNQVSSFGTTHIGKDCAFVYIQMVFDAEKFGSGVPQLSFEIKGKKVYDPRDGSTAWSDNPALCLRDYISNSVYGLKALNDEINDATTAGGFGAAANVCDQTVTLANGVSTETRYTANGFTNFSADGRGVLEVLLSTCAGRISYTNGKFNMFAGASQTPSLTITDDDLLDAVRVVTNPNSGDLFNTVKPIHINKDLNYNSADGIVYEDSTFLAADTPSGESSANYKKVLEVQLPMTVTGTMAQRLAKIALNSQRQTTTISLFTSLKFMRLQPNDWVYVTNDRLSFNQKVFEVISTSMETKTEGDIVTLGTRLELKEIDASVFNYATSDYTDPQDEGGGDDGGDYSVSAPSNLALTQQSNIEGATFKADIITTWTNVASDKIIGTEIAYKLSTDSNYTGDIFVGKGISSGIIPNVVVGKTYNVKVKHLDMNGVASDYTSAVNITISDPSSIAAPTNFSATSNRVGILLGWTNPINTNLRSIKVYRRTVNTTPTDDTHLVHTMGVEAGSPSRFYQGQMDGLTDGVTYYFWLRAITHNGTHSAFTSSVNGSFSKYDKGDVGLQNVEDKSSADIRDEIDVDDLVGTGKTFSVKPNKTELADGSTEGAFTITTDGGSATGVNVFSSGERTKLDRLRSGQDPSDASKSILNDNISISKVSGAVRLSGGSGSSSDVSFDNSDVGLGNVLNATQVKTDLTNAPDAIKNNQITISKSGPGALSLSNAGSGSVTLDNTDVGLDNVLNAAQVKVDLTNAPDAIKNAEITSTDVVGPSGKLFTSLPESGATVGATAGTNLKDSSDNTLSDEDVRNDDLSLAFSGTNIQIKKGSTQIGSNVDAPDALKNAEITSSDVVGPSGKLFTALPASGATVGATLGTNLNDSGGNALDDEDVRNSDLDIDTSGTSLRIKKGSTVIQSTTLAKSNVGLSNLNSLDSSASSKLGGIAAGATVGAVAGTNLKDSSNNTLGDEDVKNDDLSLAFSGTNIQLKKGTTQIGSNVDAPDALKNSNVDADHVGLGNVTNESKATMFASPTFTGTVAGVSKSMVGLANVSNDAQVKLDLSNAPNAIKNDQLSISKVSGAVRLSGGSSSSTDVSFGKSDVGLGNVSNDAQVKLDLSNAPNAIKNDQLSISKVSGAVRLTGGSSSSTDVSFGKSDVGLGNVSNDAQVKLDLSTAPTAIKNADLAINLNGTTFSIESQDTGSAYDSATLSKTNVGLSDLNSLESGTGTKLGGIATGATNNGSTIDTNGNITSNISLGATMTLGTNSDDKIVVGNITIDGGNGRILITD